MLMQAGTYLEKRSNFYWSFIHMHAQVLSLLGSVLNWSHTKKLFAKNIFPRLLKPRSKIKLFPRTRPTHSCTQYTVCPVRRFSLTHESWEMFNMVQSKQTVCVLCKCKWVELKYFFCLVSQNIEIVLTSKTKFQVVELALTQLVMDCEVFFFLIKMQTGTKFWKLHVKSPKIKFHTVLIISRCKKNYHEKLYLFFTWRFKWVEFKAFLCDLSQNVEIVVTSITKVLGWSWAWSDTS